MVMESPTPQCVGKEFVRQYYTMLNESPLHLHRFYSHNSSFIHGGIDPNGRDQPVMGQQDIHRRIMQLNFRDCHAKIRQVDSHATLGSGVVVQVTGELSNDGQPMRRFMQTFVLAPQSPKKYYVHNDIFRYQDEVFSDEEGEEERACTVDSEPDEEQEEILMQDSSPAIPVQDSTVSTMYYESQPVSNGTTHAENLDRVTPPRLMSESPTNVEQSQNVTTENFQATEEEHEAPVSVDSEETVNKEDQLYDVKADNKSDESPSPAEPATQSSQPELKTYANIVGRSANATVANMNTTTVNIGSGPVVDGFKPFPSQQQSTGQQFQQAPIQKLEYNPNKEFQPNNAAVSNSINANNPRVQRHRGNISNRGRDNRQTMSNRERDDSGGDSVKDRRTGTTVSYPDSQQVFVGNLPHVINEEQLKEYFSQWGPVVDIRINTKLINKSGNNSKQPPNFGFIVFDNEESVRKVLEEKKPILYRDNHRLNVEVKKTKLRSPMMMGGLGGLPCDMRGMNDGRPNSGRGGMGGRIPRGGVRMGGNMVGNRGRGGFVNSRR